MQKAFEIISVFPYLYSIKTINVMLNGYPMENSSSSKILKSSKKSFCLNISGIEISTVSLGNSICMGFTNPGKNQPRIYSVTHFSKEERSTSFTHADNCWGM